MNNKENITTKKNPKLLRIVLILAGVLFCVLALLQMPSTSSLSAHSTQTKEQPTNHAEATATLVSFPIKHIIATNFTRVNDIDIADLDGDGKLDIIGGSLNDKGFTWWKKNEDGKDGDWTAYTVNAEPGDSGTVSLQAAKIDNDGDYDVVGVVDLTGGQGQRIVWWENDGTPTNPKWREHKVILTETLKIDIADMDKDNDMDILSVANNGNIILLENPSDNDVTWESHIIATLDEFKTSAPSIYAVDINGDSQSYIDVLAGSNFAGSDNKAGIRWWQNKNGILPNETTPWPTHIVNDNINVTSIYTAYINDDDHLDIIDICCSANNLAIRWWQNGGAKKDWGDPYPVDQFNGGQDVHAADLDQDGDMDILAVGEEGVAWWKNDGTGNNGTPWPKATVDSSFKSAKIVTAADINGDGYPDIVAAGGSTIAWWQFVPDPPVLNSIDNKDGDGDYQVTWSTDQDVMTYTLQEADNPSFSSPIIDITDTQSYPITGKEPGTYYYRVRAENEIGQSLWSTRATAIVPSPARMLYLPIVLKAPPPTPTPTATNTPIVTNTSTPTTPPTRTPTYTPTPCLTAEVEDNNISGNANSICKKTWISGVIKDYYNSDNTLEVDRDYYGPIELDEAATIMLSVDMKNIPSSAGVTYRINVFLGRNSIEEFDDTGGGITDTNVFLEANERYFFRIYRYDGSENLGTYRLKWEVVSP